MADNPVVTLQQNATGFFDKIQAKHPEAMECKKGCSKCCQTDISVFDIEADRIRVWFSAQDIKVQDELKTLWTENPPTGSCTFLYSEQCSIYEARPLICRTQGLPLFISTENILDYCPLNFKAGDPPKEDWLNLERMNTLLTFAAKSTGRDQRIRLKKLKSHLLES